MSQYPTLLREPYHTLYHKVYILYSENVYGQKVKVIRLRFHDTETGTVPQISTERAYELHTWHKLEADGAP